MGCSQKRKETRWSPPSSVVCLILDYSLQPTAYSLQPTAFSMTTSSLHAILFDFDGTLAPSLPLWVKAYQIALAHFGHHAHRCRGSPALYVSRLVSGCERVRHLYGDQIREQVDIGLQAGVRRRDSVSAGAAADRALPSARCAGRIGDIGAATSDRRCARPVAGHELFDSVVCGDDVPELQAASRAGADRASGAAARPARGHHGRRFACRYSGRQGCGHAHGAISAGRRVQLSRCRRACVRPNRITSSQTTASWRICWACRSWREQFVDGQRREGWNASR